MLRRALPTKSRFALPLVAAIAFVMPACSQGPEGEVEQSTDQLSRDQRLWTLTTIRDWARNKGMGNAFLLAGIANHETNLVQCWSDATQHCQGPASPDCGGGPVLAGSGDGPCGDQQGGLGLFQFDAGNYWQTLDTYSNDVLTVGGSTVRAVDFVIRIVRDSPYTTNAETNEKALAWINTFDINNGAQRDQWIKTVLSMYNGCQEGWPCWAPRYQQYNDGLQGVLNEVPFDFWGGGGGGCPGAKGRTIGAIDAKYRALGGCGSVLGATLTDETPTPDGFGRYNVFERGSIYWTENTGAFEVHGEIRDKWAELGWETAEGSLGYPITDETPTPDNIGKYNVFERGSIYWTAETGPHAVLGVIRDKYKELGWEAGALGYPTSDEYDVPEGKKSDFQNGYITWNKDTGATTAVFKHK